MLMTYAAAGKIFSTFLMPKSLLLKRNLNDRRSLVEIQTGVQSRYFSDSGCFQEMWDVNVRTMAPLVSNDWIEFLDLKTAARGPTRRRTAPPAGLPRPHAGRFGRAIHGQASVGDGMMELLEHEA